MSEIPYFFETPIPKFFREEDWFDSPNAILFVTWTFSKCSTVHHRVKHDGKELILAPYEFITGRGKSADDCFLSEEAFRHQLKVFTKAGLLKKTPNSTPNRFSCYVWVTERFSKFNPQLNPHVTPDSTPTEPPQSRIKKKRYKKDHQPYPSSKVRADGLTDDLSSNLEKEENKIQIYENVFMTQSILDECIRIKGSIESVKHAVEYVMRSPRRTAFIKDWPATLAKWVIKNDIKPRIKENEDMAKRLSKLYENFTDGNGHSCSIYVDKKKDQVGLLFQPSSPYLQPFFISYADGEFQEKASKYIRENKMQKGRITDS